MRAVDTSSVSSPSNDGLDPDQRDFSGDTIILQMTTSRRFNSKGIVNGSNETRGNKTFEEDVLPVGEEIYDR